MALIPIDLGGGRVAHIREETTVGELEDAKWLETHWLPTQPEHTQESKKNLCIPMVVVIKWEGMGEGFTWPDLICPLSTDQPAIEARYMSMRKNIGLKTLQKLVSAINLACLPSEQLEGN